MTGQHDTLSLTDQRAANLAENPFAGQGPVLLDIGDDIGAIVLRLPAGMHGAEIEIHEVGESHSHAHPHHHGGKQGNDHEHGVHHNPHVAVVERPTPDGTQFTAVFPHVQAGTYDLREQHGSVSVRVEVTGGSVTQTDWSCGEPPELSVQGLPVQGDHHFRPPPG